MNSHVFRVEEFEGSGQYLIRHGVKNPYWMDGSDLCSRMYKVCYKHGNHKSGHMVHLITMTDGLIAQSFHVTQRVVKSGIDATPVHLVFDKAVAKLVSKLNYENQLYDIDVSKRWRFATREEVMKVFIYIAQHKNWIRG